MKTQYTVMMILPYFPPEGGGLERYALQIAARLQRTHNWRVVMVASAPRGQSDSKTTQDGITIYRLSYRFKLSNTPLGLLWGRKLRRIIAVENPDVINAHTPVPGIADVAAGIAGRRPFVTTYHTGSMKKGNGLVDLLIGAYERWVLPRVLNHSGAVICSSDFVRDFLAGWSQKTITVTPGIDQTIFKPGPAKDPARHNMVFVAGYGPAYHHKGLADAMAVVANLSAEFPSLSLTVVGEGDVPHYQALADRLGIADRVEFAGHKSWQELAPLYHAATLTILPTDNDSYPMTLAESMATATPVVSTIAGGVPTLVQHGVTGLLTEPHDVPALTAAVRQILEDPKLARKMGQAGHAKAIAELTWDSKAATTHNVLTAALKPHVAQLTAYYPPHLGGIENVVHQLSATLARGGYGVEVFTSGAHVPADHQDPDVPGLTVHRFGNREVLHTPIMPGLFGALMRLPRHSVMHLHISQALIPEISWLAARLRGIPLIAHVHLDVEPSSLVGQIIFRPYKKIFLRFVLRHSDRVVFLSEDQRTSMGKKYGLDPARTLVLPNGVSADFFLPERTQFHSPLRALYVGRLVVQKRPERAVQAIATLPNIHLDVVGDGEDRAALEAYARDHKIKNVIFHGPKRGAELRRFYANADLLIMTSDREGMPLVLLEAMASALPIVGSDVVGIRELIRGTGVLVADPSADAFAQALAGLTTDPKRLAALSAASLKAAGPYSWDRLAKEIAGLYTEVLS